MKIVIDIPNRYYEMLKDFNFEIIADRCNYKTIQVQVINAIKDGKPLPEHHGRLIDADALEYEPYLMIKGNGMYEKVKGYFNIDNAPTIIEGSESE